MRPPSNKKNIIIIVAVIVIAALAFYYMSSSPSATDTGLQSNSANAVGASEIALLNQVEALRIDTTFFNDPAYKSLVDYSVAITPEAVGRPNPFAPVPGVPNPNATVTSGGAAAASPAR